MQPDTADVSDEGAGSRSTLDTIHPLIGVLIEPPEDDPSLIEAIQASIEAAQIHRLATGAAK